MSGRGLWRLRQGMNGAGLSRVVDQNAESCRSIALDCSDASVVGDCSEYRTLVFRSRDSDVRSKPLRPVPVDRVNKIGGWNFAAGSLRSGIAGYCRRGGAGRSASADSLLALGGRLPESTASCKPKNGEPELLSMFINERSYLHPVRLNRMSPVKAAIRGGFVRGYFMEQLANHAVQNRPAGVQTPRRFRGFVPIECFHIHTKA